MREYNRLGPLIRDAFGAYHISDLEQAEFQNGNIVQRENSILNGILNYRWRHLLKADVNTGYGKWTAGFVYRYYSYLDRIDEVFEIDVYPTQRPSVGIGKIVNSKENIFLTLRPDSILTRKQLFPLWRKTCLTVLL